MGVNYFQQQFLLNGGDQLTNVSNILEANRHFLDQQQQQLSNGLMNPQMQQKSRLLNKYDQINGHNNLVLNNQQQQQQQQQQQSRLHQQFTPQSSSIVDDDLGFDPFIETQKALAELMHDELVQTQNNHKLLENNQQQLQRPRMPPPGFNVNHMNTYGGFQQQPPATSVAQGKNSSILVDGRARV
jgi:CCR4-NOT transcription complex subunit 4